jgi:hypothetical protein
VRILLCARNDAHDRQVEHLANSKSRSSCPGTAMIAPVPYSMST